MRILLTSLLFGLATITTGFAEDPPAGFTLHKFNPPQQQPVTEGGVTTFHIDPGVCSDVDYGDGRGETDCKNGNVRSIIGRNFDTARLGDSIEYRFDVRIDPSITYDGFQSMSAAGFYPGGIDSHLRIASWEGPQIKSFIYMVKVSKTLGIDFLANQCQAPEDFGEWVTFSLKTLWSANEKGWVVASCDGKIIYADEAIATNQSPHCYQSNECEPWVPKDPKEFNVSLGPVLMGFGPDWKIVPGATSVFDEFQPDGITVQMRNISVTKGVKLYEDADVAIIKQLQQVLKSLGCDAGPADGVPGTKTRNAAMSCRAFPPGVLPTKLTVATAPTFLDLYQAPDTAALPPGALPQVSTGKLKAEIVVHVAEEGAMKSGSDIEVNSNILGKIEGAKKGENELYFIMLGKFDYTRNDFFELEFILQDTLNDSEKAAFAKCSGRTTTFPDGSVHAGMKMQRIEAGKWVGPSNADCLIAALPKSQGAQISFLLDHFQDVAIGMINDKSIDQVRHEGVEIFFRRVALGDVMLTRS